MQELDRQEVEANGREVVRRGNNMATLCAVLYGDQWEKYGMMAK